MSTEQTVGASVIPETAKAKPDYAIIAYYVASGATIDSLSVAVMDWMTKGYDLVGGGFFAREAFHQCVAKLR